MAVRKPKRVRRLRGSRTHGYGRIGQHRKGGQRGGKGKTGGKKHNWTYVTAKTPNRFGKHGFHRHTDLRQQHRTINIGDLVPRLHQFTDPSAAPKDTPLAIDLTSQGYDKVLGAGTISIPLKVTAPLFTYRAAEKIKAAGGSVKGTIQKPTKHPAPSLISPPAKPKVKPKAPVKTKPKPKARPKAKAPAKPKARPKAKAPTKTKTSKSAKKPKTSTKPKTTTKGKSSSKS